MKMTQGRFLYFMIYAYTQRLYSSRQIAKVSPMKANVQYRLFVAGSVFFGIGIQQDDRSLSKVVCRLL
jgi:hypothetical protein